MAATAQYLGGAENLANETKRNFSGNVFFFEWKGLFVPQIRGIKSSQCNFLVGNKVSFPKQRAQSAKVSHKHRRQCGALNATCQADKILVANRGEIAVRVIRTAHELGIPCVAVYSTIDKDALHVKLADESVCIGEAPSNQSYLVIPNVLSAAISRKCTMLHPGYGFLAENAVFVEMCREHGINYIGPNPDSIRVMGDKSTARDTMKKAGVPTVPGSDGLLQSTEEAIGFPVMIKRVDREAPPLDSSSLQVFVSVKHRIEQREEGSIFSALGSSYPAFTAFPFSRVVVYQGNCLLSLSFAWLIMAKFGDHSKEGDLYDRCLIGKILTKKIIHKIPLEMALRNIWGRPRGFRIEEIGPYMYQFIFDSKGDANRILRKGPWLFRNSWIILQRWQEDLNSLEKGPNKVPIWIQMRGLPLHRITHSMARKVGSIIGKVKETGLFQESNGDNLFLKALVEIDINFKVIHGIKIDESYWVELKYERLCQFCFGCGQIGHNLDECEEKKNFRRNDPPLGTWLKAYHPESEKLKNNHLVKREDGLNWRWLSVEEIAQQIVNMIDEDVNVGFEEGLEVRKGEKWKQRKRRSEIRLISLGLYIIGEGITIPSTKRRKKDCLVIDNNLATIGVYEELKTISVQRKGKWEASPGKPPMEG
ncbi:biotin carboxylase 2, chloroplastic [Senna tora]|uniref:Biotin carboxylase 2, chloroplastic n=1 Tax=Senna tora TaxID=362788 RepID=A0A834T8D7_9FABA|nr:biotin carboxylase 2, chloroplastic [Senna tora]